MSLCLLGKEDLDTLQSYVEGMFAHVQNKNIEKITFDPKPFSKESLTDVTYVVPVEDTHSLGLEFQIPDYSECYESSPLYYTTRLVSHKGPSSLLSALKATGWVNFLYSGRHGCARGFSFYRISLDLSEEGVEHINEIMKLCFQYLNLLRKKGPQKWINDEISEIGLMEFTYKEKEQQMSYVSDLCSDLHLFKMEHILSAGYLTTKFEPELINELLDHLKPELTRVCIASKKFEGKTDKTEKWYGTQYRIEKLSHEVLEELQNCGLNETFKLPVKNDFIPTDFSLIKHENGVDAVPKVILKTPITRLWYKGDDKFSLPKASIKFEFRNPLIYIDTNHFNMITLFVDLLYDSLTEYTYPADLAGLSYGIFENIYGINLSFHGFNEKIDILVSKIVKRMIEFKIDENRFKFVKESYKRDLKNFQANQPYEHASYYMKLLLSEKSLSNADLLETVDDLNVQELQEFIPKFLTQDIFVESIVFGNISKEKAIEIVQSVEDLLKSIKADKLLKPLMPSQNINYRHVRLPDNSESILIKNNNIHKTIGIETYFQCYELNSYNNALIDLFCQIINEPTYNVLRTQEQLGYIVESDVKRFRGIQGVSFILQSDKLPDYLDERIECFISTIKDILDSMSETEFKNHIEALSVIKLEEPKTISEQCDIYWNEIITRQYNFEGDKIEVEELQKLTKDDVIQFYNKFIHSSSSIRRKLTVYVNPEELNNEFESKIKKPIIKNINEFKARLSLCPLPTPSITVD